MKNTKRASAFTLVELLVVISIIALLLALLMPALSKARMQGKSIVCRSNIKQLTLATRTYSIDNGGKIFYFAENNTEMWYHLLAPFMGKKDKQRITGIQNWKEAMPGIICPETRTPGSAAYIGTGGANGAYGTAKNTWLYMQAEGSYGLNYWLVENRPNTEVFEMQFVKPCYFVGKFDTLKGDIPLYGDSNWLGAWPGFLFERTGRKKPFPVRPIVPDDLKTGYFKTSTGYTVDQQAYGKQLARFCIDRHGKAVNMGFTDGHASKVTLEGLWGLKWNKLYAPETNYKFGMR